MRISILSAFYPFRGGIAQFNARLFRSLEKNHPVKAFTFTKQYPALLFPGKTQFVEKNDQVDAIPAKRIVNPFNPFSYFKAVRALRKSDPELYVSNYWMTFFGVCFGFLSNRLGSNNVRIALIHNLIPHEPRFFDKFFSRYYIKNHDGFIVMSDSVESDLLSLYPEAKYMKLQHPWYDHFGDKIEREEACTQLGIDPEKFNVLFFGLIRDYKGLDILLEAFDGLSTEFQLIIAGEVYGDRDKYMKIIDSSRNKERIIFHDRYIADAEVKVYFSAVDCCVLPYRSATQSGITATSFHFEVPVLVTDVGGLKAIVEPINAGVVVSEASPEMIALGLIALSNKERLASCKHAIRNAKKLNSWDHFASSLVQFAETIRKSEK